ncbi:MAG: putative Restriction endonuclease EcoRV [Candidatus Thorarchaeota archaeon]|nr:MAG: putative Restriction endonuclease EcoRV [Candidatus Thorarchaeota archaeon]
MKYWENLIEDIEEIASEVEWNVKGILLDNDELIEMPSMSTVVTALIECFAIAKYTPYFDSKKINYTFGGERSYPDIVLEGKGIENDVIALDIKTCRMKSKKKISGFTLGSYGEYFRNPAVKKRGCLRPYGEFRKHIVVGFIYKWDKEASTPDKVEILERIVAEKWQLSSRKTGTGTTTAIGSITELSRILNRDGEFSSEEEFEKYWRKYEKKKKS